MVMVKKLSKIFFVLFVLSAFCSSAVFAIGMGSVDTRVLLMLHPNMSNFDYSNARFFRDQNENKDIDKVYEELRKASEKAQKNNAEINKQIKEFSEQKFVLSQNLLREEQFFAPGDLKLLQKEKTDLETILKELEKERPKSTVEAGLKDAKKEDLKERIKIIEEAIKNSANIEKREPEIKKLKEQIAGIDLKLAELNNEIRINEEKAVKVIYLTTEETDEKLAAIKSEIKQIIADAAKEANITLVIDNSFAMRTPERKDRKTMIPAVDESPDVVSASLFHSFSNFTIDKELEANLEMPNEGTAAQHLLAGRSVGLESNLKQYLEFRNYMPERVADFSNGSVFLSGTTDLTPWCARKIFDKYNVPDSLKQKYMQIIRDFMNFEKDPFIREREY